MLFIKGIERVGHYQKQVGTRFRNLKKKEKGLSGRGDLTFTTIDLLQIYIGVASYTSKCCRPAKYEIKFFSFIASWFFK